MAKVNVLGVEFDNMTLTETVSTISTRFAAGTGTFVVTANPEIVMYAREHADYAQLIAERADIVTADGIGVVKGAGMLGTPLKERVTGFDLMNDLFQVASDKQLRVYLIGAKQEVNDAAVAKVRAQYPGLVIAGAHDGYFDLSDASVAAAVVATKPDMVFAALGFPKQENFLAAMRTDLPGAVLMGVGGSFDVLSGTAKRAPVWMQRIHLEWFYRLLKQPSRIGRMMVLPQFLQAVRAEKRTK